MHYRNRNTAHTTHTTTAAPRRRGIHFWGPRHNHHTVGTTTAGTTTTRRSHGGLFHRHNHAATGGMHTGTHGGTTAPVHHHKRHVTLGDKISGAMMKLRGSLTHRPGVKAAGTRRMHGTDGRGSRRIW